MATDDDHNYYSQAQRRLPDYNVDGQPRYLEESAQHAAASPSAAAATADSLPLLTAQYYRQSQQLNTQKRPTITTDFAGGASNAAGNPKLAADHAATNSPDPHDFYRTYPDSSRREGGARGSYGGIGLATSTPDDSMSTLHSSARPAQFAARGNGYAARGGHTDARLAPSSRQAARPVETQRGRRQSSLQALVDKFNQNPDEVPPLPSHPGSRSTSANQSPASGTGALSFKRRVSTDPPLKRAPTPGERSASGSVASRKPIGATDKSGAANNVPRPGMATSPVSVRTTSTSSNATASQSMTNLGQPSPQHKHAQAPPPPKLLFGEIPSASQPHPGFGIPGQRRRGSEGSMNYTHFSSKDNSAHNSHHVSPSSPTAWYMGVTPSLDGIDLSNAAPPRPGMHRRSYSELGPNPGALTQTVSNMSPPQEQPTLEMSPQPDKRPVQSRIPVISRRGSAVSTEGPSFSSREAASAPRTPERASISPVPKKSSRAAKPEPLTQPSSHLAAFISEPPAIKSPPLRSSRPRQPVSTATTSASRARAAAAAEQRNATRDKSAKNLPELGGVDLAARRERIQRAFTTKVKEKEIETEKKRQSLIHEAQMLRNHETKAALKAEERDSKEKSVIKEHSFDNLRSEQDVFSAPEPKKRVLKINTGGPEGARTVVIPDEDSPTLGTAGFLVPANHDDPDSDAEPGSSITSTTEETFFDHEPQESTEPGPGNEGPASPARQEQSRKFSGPGTHASILSSRSQDRDDVESIQIMLQDIPITDVIETSSSRGANRRSLSENLEASGSTVQGPWSPDSSMMAPSVRESDTYNTVNRLLDSYHDASLKSPQSLQEFQRQLLEYSPEPARLSSWDPQKVTQLYLQHVAPNRAPPPVPPSFDGQPQHFGESNTNLSQSSRSPAETSRAEQVDVPAGRAAKTNSLETPVVSNLKRASASLNDRDDWANTSPSMLDWIHHQALDTPIEEKTEPPFTLSSTHPVEGSHTTDSSASSMLPDIQGLGGLGIDITPERPSSSSLSGSQKTSLSAIRQSVQRPSPLGSESYKSEKQLPVLPSDQLDGNDDGDSADASTPEQAGVDVLPRLQANDDAGPYLQQRGRTNTQSTLADPPSTENTSVNESLKSSLSPAEQKRLTKRRHILKELVDTESSFGQDMTVVVDIYKGTSNVILNSPEDVRVLFGNAADIVQFSMTFLDALKQSSKSVYVLPKSKRWKSKRDSSATTGSTTTDDQVSIAGMEISDDERDRMTTIGTAFDQYLTQMEKVYTEYLKNHDAANQKLRQLQESEKVKIWLKECRAYAHDLTSAWDLDSLLVKPVQRILKYPLLLKEILEVTPENHPDYFALDNAVREMVGVSKRINEAKRRADLVEQVNSGPTITKQPKRKDTDTRLGLSKAFGRRADKAKQQLGTVENVQDRAYNAVAEKFGSHFFQLQVVMRDVEMYVTEVQGWVNKFNDFALAIESYMDVGQTSHTEIESKWRRFRLSMREMQMTALTDHINAVRKHVIDPMTTLLKLHDGPQRLMDKRKKRVAEYAKYKAIRDRGEKPDKRTMEQGEQFVAVNETLKDELPKLFSLTGKLVESCLQNFVQLQMQWLNVWKAKLRQAIDCSQLPESFNAIFNQFSGDFRYTEAQVLSLGLCNGSLLTNTANFVNFLVPDQGGMGSGLLHDDTSRRPSGSTDETRSRATSSTMFERARARGLSANSNKSPMIPTPDFGRSAEGLGISGQHMPYGNYPPPPRADGKRIRASSVASGRSPAGTEGAGSYRNHYGAHHHGHRPSTSTGRSFDSPSMPRPSYEGGSGLLHPDADSSRYGTSASSSSHRHSGVFSSAMPMSDSPRTESPSLDGVDPANINVLFLAASVYEFNIDRARREAGYPYLTYVAGEIFDVIGEKGELWLAKNQDDGNSQIGWIWNKHFAKLAG